ncbi:MAG: glycosyltransferase [Sphingopyxis sp.]|uniref:glycosyltransferase n=1 Tax=Sphingopyxis sp. TaxID=1908224 RepID=UPI001A3C5743|nr:glycosyltransferase [Sphingopyxis sp.]MBL9071712.1 glycosyltransferase [Sphingopyxis sp.]
MTAISVCLATYNGAAFVAEQLRSILDQLTSDDEIIIVDDGSSDDTLDVVNGFEDARIRVYPNEKNVGVNETFARAVALATKPIIFLSDQDDVWTPGRKAIMLKAFSDPRVLVVAGNYQLIDRDGGMLNRSLAPDLKADESRSRLLNLFRIFQGSQNYYGCAMAFRTSLRAAIFPYPPKMECHDIWIGMIGVTSDAMSHIEAPVLLHRVHGRNASIIRRPILKKLASRVFLSYQLAVAVVRGSNLRRRLLVP